MRLNVKETPHFCVTLTLGLYVGLCLALGGGTMQGYAVDALLWVLALPLLAAACLRFRWSTMGKDARVLLSMAALLVVWISLQLLPLPPSLWQSLSGRSELAAELSAAGLPETWRPISLDRDSTLRALFGLLPGFSVGLLALTLPVSQRIRVIKFVIFVAVFAALLSLAQLAGGPDSKLRWHEITNLASAVGPFANRNHQASLLASALPLAIVWFMAAASPQQRADRQPVMVALGAVIVISLMIGLAITGSRAGVAIGFMAFAFSAVLIWRLARRHSSSANTKVPAPLRWLLATVFLATVLVVQFALLQLIERFDTDPLEEGRWKIAEVTHRAVEHYGLLGTGAGTFVPVYQSVERLDERDTTYVNRAHNDFLEWWLEGGVLLLLLSIAGVALLTKLTVRAWRAERHAAWRMGAALAAWVTVVHSLFDYPLRTIGISVVFVLLLTCLVGGTSETKQRARNVGKLARNDALKTSSSESLE